MIVRTVAGTAGVAAAGYLGMRAGAAAVASHGTAGLVGTLVPGYLVGYRVSEDLHPMVERRLAETSRVFRLTGDESVIGATLAGKAGVLPWLALAGGVAALGASLGAIAVQSAQWDPTRAAEISAAL